MSILSDADIKNIADAILSVLKKDGAALVQYVQSEAAKFAQSLETIASLYAAGKIDESEAAGQLNLQKSAAQTVLTSVEGISGIIAAQAINQGLQAVGDIVNRAIGFTLL
jgi:hypothetical protein